MKEPPWLAAMASRPWNRGPAAGAWGIIMLTVALTAIVLAAVLPNLWYGLHDVSDIPLYHYYASRMARGESPFTAGFLVEYPPLAMPLFRLPGHLDDAGDYAAWFSRWMALLTLVTAVLTTSAALCLWGGGGRALVTAVLFPAGVAFTGAILLNRYDAAVALVVAGVLLCLVRRWYATAALVIGAGFALKFTPAILLPLVLLLAGPAGRSWKPVAAFVAAAVVPFIALLPMDPAGVWHVFRYHMERPLQIESVLGTPILLGELSGTGWVRVVDSHGSQGLVAPGAQEAAAASGPLTLLAIAGVYWLIWRRLARLKATPEDLAPAVLALLLALVTFSKVLSPQFFIWLLPAWVLAATRDRILAVGGSLVLILTQVEFPSLYWSLVALEPTALTVVIVRNLLVLAVFFVAVWRLWQLPAGVPRQ